MIKKIIPLGDKNKDDSDEDEAENREGPASWPTSEEALEIHHHQKKEVHMHRHGDEHSPQLEHDRSHELAAAAAGQVNSALEDAATGQMSAALEDAATGQLSSALTDA